MSNIETSNKEIAIANWRCIASEPLGNYRVFTVRRDISVDPRDNREHDFFVIEAPDWVNVIPLTLDGKTVLIEQYRHGTREITLEIPGGMVDDGESPDVAARRELLEETGFSGGEIQLLSRTRPNPAIQNNWLHSFVARNCVFSQMPQFDSSEHVAVRLVSLEEVAGLIASGAINHSLVVAAFYSLLAKQGKAQFV
jgi:8-oxo-dGTP pyrophosphatase MutT (NUDIX family)